MKLGFFKTLVKIFFILFLVASSSILFFFAIPSLQNSMSAAGIKRGSYSHNSSDDATVKKLKAKLKELDAKNSKGEGQNYIIINTSENSFKLYKEGKLYRQGLCSTGKDELLIGLDGKKFLFRSPRGVLTVKSKQQDPVWVRPDWDFIEQGQKVPSARSEDRYDYGSLGKYKLELGDGYKLHGTLWQRMIGLPVTHGCIRFLDDDIEAIYKTLPTKSKVYIY